jgi:hypothetical protein
MPHQVQYFCANVLYTKVCRDWLQLKDQSVIASLSGMLLSFLRRASPAAAASGSTEKVVVLRVCLAASALAIKLQDGLMAMMQVCVGVGVCAWACVCACACVCVYMRIRVSFCTYPGPPTAPIGTRPRVPHQPTTTPPPFLQEAFTFLGGSAEGVTEADAGALIIGLALLKSLPEETDKVDMSRGRREELQTQMRQCAANILQVGAACVGCVGVCVHARVT